MDQTVIGSKEHPLGGFYLAKRADGVWLAGRTPDTAREFVSASAAYDWFHPQAVSGVHWAWNLCYLLEEHVE